MEALSSADAAAFRFINLGLQHPVLDFIMPRLGSSTFLGPPIACLSLAVLVKGGLRGRLCLGFVLLALLVGDTLICNSLKEAISRPRPFQTLPEARVLIGKGGSESMPSSHTANWFAATCVAFLYFPASLKYMLPFAFMVGFSRIYNGVHYPADVLAGAILAIAYSLALVFTVNWLWKIIGQRFFPLWWNRVPSLIRLTRKKDEQFTDVAPPARDLARSPASGPSALTSNELLDRHWLRLGYLFIGLTLAARWLFISSGAIELSEDESYQWLWSKHLAASYYSKPPLIAFIHFLGTALWGDTPFGVRFFSPLIAGIISLLLFRFVSRNANPRLAVALVAIVTFTPMLAAGAILMTIDSLSVAFWTAALLTGWKALHENSTAAWAWTGLWMGLGTLSKYTGLFQWLCWASFFLLWPPARGHLRRPGIYLALGINLLCLIPVLSWNHTHGWITLTHLADRGGLDEPWRFNPARIWEFLLSETLLLNPIFFCAAVWAAARFWRWRPRSELMVYLFAMGAPLFIVYACYAFRSRVQPNWIVPAVLPLFCLMAIFWEPSVRERLLWKRWLMAGLVFGAVIVTLLHDTDLIQKAFGRRLPPERDPLTRVRGWNALARTVGQARKALMEEGPPVFIIGDHYGVTSQLTFYLPEARESLPSQPLVFYRATDKPKNQFFFWRGYSERKGENAIFVQQLPRPVLKSDWFWIWIKGGKQLSREAPRPRRSPPPDMEKQFSEVRDLGIREIRDRGRIPRYVQLFECRGLR